MQPDLGGSDMKRVAIGHGGDARDAGGHLGVGGGRQGEQS